MKKLNIVTLIVTAVSAFSLSSPSYASEAKKEARKGGVAQIQNQNRNREMRANNNNAEQDVEEPKNNTNKGNGMPTWSNQDRRSEVAKAVQELLASPDRVGGIGEQVRIIARAQNQNRDELERKLDSIEGRSRIARLLFGPNAKDISDAKALLEKNQEQIKELLALEAKLTDVKEIAQLDKQIKVLQQADKQIQTVIEKNEQGFSVFGWLVRLFNK